MDNLEDLMRLGKEMGLTGIMLRNFVREQQERQDRLREREAAEVRERQRFEAFREWREYEMRKAEMEAEEKERKRQHEISVYQLMLGGSAYGVLPGDPYCALTTTTTTTGIIYNSIPITASNTWVSSSTIPTTAPEHFTTIPSNNAQGLFITTTAITTAATGCSAFTTIPPRLFNVNPIIITTTATAISPITTMTTTDFTAFTTPAKCIPDISTSMTGHSITTIPLSYPTTFISRAPTGLLSIVIPGPTPSTSSPQMTSTSPLTTCTAPLFSTIIGSTTTGPPTNLSASATSPTISPLATFTASSASTSTPTVTPSSLTASIPSTFPPLSASTAPLCPTLPLPSTTILQTFTTPPTTACNPSPTVTITTLPLFTLQPSSSTATMPSLTTTAPPLFSTPPPSSTTTNIPSLNTSTVPLLSTPPIYYVTNLNPLPSAYNSLTHSTPLITSTATTVSTLPLSTTSTSIITLPTTPTPQTISTTPLYSTSALPLSTAIQLPHLPSSSTMNTPISSRSINSPLPPATSLSTSTVSVFSTTATPLLSTTNIIPLSSTTTTPLASTSTTPQVFTTKLHSITNNLSNPSISTTQQSSSSTNTQQPSPSTTTPLLSNPTTQQPSPSTTTPLPSTTISQQASTATTTPLSSSASTQLPSTYIISQPSITTAVPSNTTTPQPSTTTVTTSLPSTNNNPQPTTSNTLVSTANISLTSSITSPPTISSTPNTTTTSTPTTIPLTTPSTLNTTSITTITATPASSINYGWKVIKTLYIAGRQVLYTILLWGTPGKATQTNFLTYLENLDRNLSTANYTVASQGQRKFNSSQEQKIKDNPPGDKFDISLLYPCMRLACENMARLNDAAWYTVGVGLEQCLYQIKQQRNTAVHEDLELTESVFLSKEGTLRNLFITALTAAQNKYAQITPAQRDDEIQFVNEELDRIIDEPVGIDDLLRQCGAALIHDLIREVTVHIKTISQYDVLMDPLSFLSDRGNRLRLRVQKIFIKIRLVKEGQQRRQTDMDYETLLTVTHNSSSKPQVLVVQGLAGGGKTTLVTLVTAEWLEGGQGTLEHLSHYQLLLRVQCRDSHLTSYENLLEDLLLPASLKYGNLLPRLIKQCRLLIIVDGLDERNTNSRELIRNLLHQFQRAPDCTFLCTTRPESLQDFLKSVPNRYEVNIVELVGIPKALRSQFVQKYFEEIKVVTGSDRSSKALVSKVETEKDLEHYRLPMNLAILAWLCFYKPNIVNEMTTQTELYHLTHQLCQEKLDERLINNEQTKDLHRKHRQEKLNACLSDIYKIGLVGLSRDELALGQQAIDHLRSVCKYEELPEDEVMAAFFSLRRTWNPHGIREQYSAPHKGLQDYYAAMHIVKTLQSQPGSVTIISVIQATIGGGQINLQKYQNVLQHLAGLLHLYLDPLPDQLAQEAVDLLQQAGVTTQERWLDILEDTQAAPGILAAIAKHFPIDEEIEVTNGRLKSYTALLPHLQPREVNVKVYCNPGRLAEALERHTCSKLNLMYQFHHPDLDAFPPDHIIQKVLSNVESFCGQLSPGMAPHIPLNLTDLHLAICSDSQAALIPRLHDLVNLKSLHFHVTKEVSPGVLTALPDVRSREGYGSLYLYVTDINIGDEQRVAQVTKQLQPSDRYRNIYFPRAVLDARLWRKVVELMGKEDIRAGGLYVPGDNVTSQEESRLYTLAGKHLNGAGFTMMASYDHEDWEK